MLSSMLKQHLESQEVLRSQVNKKKLEAEQEAEKLAVKVVDDLNRDIAQAYLNQHTLDSETRKLQANISKLTKQIQQWMIVSDNLNSAVKELGDVTSWATSIENDVQFIATIIENVYTPKSDEQDDS